LLKLKLSTTKDQVKVELRVKTKWQLSWDYIQVILMDQTLELEESMLWEKLWVTLHGEELAKELMQLQLLHQLDALK